MDLTKILNVEPPPLVLPTRFEKADLDIVPIDVLKEKAKAYLDNFYIEVSNGIGCLFLGRAGTWKSYTAAAMCRVVHEKAKLPVLFVQCPLVLGRMDRDRFSDKTAATINQLNNTPFVVMDDFSQIPPNSFGAQVLLEIAEARFGNLLPTIWTGNIEVGDDPVAAISSMYGASFGRRVYETSNRYRVKTK